MRDGCSFSALAVTAPRVSLMGRIASIHIDMAFCPVIEESRLPAVLRSPLDESLKEGETKRLNCHRFRRVSRSDVRRFHADDKRTFVYQSSSLHQALTAMAGAWQPVYRCYTTAISDVIPLAVDEACTLDPTPPWPGCELRAKKRPVSGTGRVLKGTTFLFWVFLAGLA
jgi:hypothetical protein